MEKSLANGLLSESGKELPLILGLANLDEDDFEASLDICQVILDFDGLESEFDVLLKIN